MTKSRNAANLIRTSCSDLKHVGEVSVVCLDLSSLQSVRDCASQLLSEEETIHILVNNAGIVTSKREVTVDGYEMQFATNHLGHFLLTLLLLPRLVRSAPARIINVTSEPHCIGNTLVSVYFMNTAFFSSVNKDILLIGIPESDYSIFIMYIAAALSCGSS
ncbi:hypothetical protein J6590_023310 [Homalodisca vitripennis]|nr:hypothetical protein J6590_023310 [Homalodisca vitripennis]